MQANLTQNFDGTLIVPIRLNITDSNHFVALDVLDRLGIASSIVIQPNGEGGLELVVFDGDPSDASAQHIALRSKSAV